MALLHFAEAKPGKKKKKASTQPPAVTQLVQQTAPPIVTSTPIDLSVKISWADFGFHYNPKDVFFTFPETFDRETALWIKQELITFSQNKIRIHDFNHVPIPDLLSRIGKQHYKLTEAQKQLWTDLQAQNIVDWVTQEDKRRYKPNGKFNTKIPAVFFAFLENPDSSADDLCQEAFSHFDISCSTTQSVTHAKPNDWLKSLVLDETPDDPF